MIGHACRGTGCWCAGPARFDPSVTRPDGTPVLVAPACPHGNVAGIDCCRCKDARIAELEREVARLSEQVESWQRAFGQVGVAKDVILAQRDAALAEVARLEALIVEAASWNVMEDPLHAEADRIRDRKGD